MHADEMVGLAQQLGLTGFDLLVVADGSGMVLDKPCGWFWVSYQPSLGKVAEQVGGTSAGTNNYAELEPFLHALWFHHSKSTQNHSFSPPVRVELVSDSEVSVRCGNGQYARNANLPLWAGIDWFVKNGYRLHWNHVRRNSNPANKRADGVGRFLRHHLEDFVTRLSMGTLPG